MRLFKWIDSQSRGTAFDRQRNLKYISVKPTFSFSFDDIEYMPIIDVITTTESATTRNLTNDEMVEITDWIDTLDFSTDTFDMLVWRDGVSNSQFAVEDGGGKKTVDTKPVLTFSYTDLYYEPVTRNIRYVNGGVTYILSPEQLLEVKDYLDAFDFTPAPGPTLGHGVDENGNYQGYGDVSGFYDTVPSAPTSEYDIWNFTNTVWDYLPPYADLKATARAIIDNEAGIKRNIYITSVPGQEATYIYKAQQCQAFKDAGYPGDVTPYPLVEAERDATGDTAQVAADAILAEEAAWMVLAKQIEKERRGGKIAVDAAVDVAGIDSARDAAIAAIQAIS